VKAAGLRRNFVEVSDEGILVNAKDSEEYAHLLSGHSLMEPYPDARIRIVSEKPFYGPGAHQLLQLICETGSVSEACRNMGLSYGKGRAIIFDMEQQLGYRVLESRQGGKTGGYSIVTEKAQKLMKNYSGLSEEAQKSINRLFLKYFKP
jgi:molybdate transport repressor ModE-like protein